jgi:hypothetical protein
MGRRFYLGHRTALAVEMLYGSKWLICVGSNAGQLVTSLNVRSTRNFPGK